MIVFMICIWCLFHIRAQLAYLTWVFDDTVVPVTEKSEALEVKSDSNEETKTENVDASHGLNLGKRFEMF